MDKDVHFLQNRFYELATVAYDRNIYTYTDFLNLNELNIFNNYCNQLPPVKFELTGGNVYAERKLIKFMPQDVYYEQEDPISIIKIAPLNPKYADKLTHRDFLGAILNLGIDRCKIGDIFVDGNLSYVYCIDSICDYIIENLRKIRHTLVDVQISCVNNAVISPSFKEIKGTIGNVRLDSLISLAFGESRSSIVSFIEGGKVFVNGKLITSNGYTVKENDIISVRGKGRFVFNKIVNVTKKKRNLVSLNLYI